jgi:hypothetical protein
VPHEPLDERLVIETLCQQLHAVFEASHATPGLKTIAAIIVAARRARSTSMPAFVASSMLARYIHSDPLPTH